MFKVGDEVAVWSSFNRFMKLSKVERITHKGAAVWVDGERYGVDGFRRGGQRITAIKPEERVWLRRQELAKMIFDMSEEKLRALSLDNLQFAAEMLGLVPMAKKEGAG